MFSSPVSKAFVEALESRMLLAVSPLKDGITANFGFGAVTLNGITYFRATDTAHGAELWRTDGTTAGTALVKDINTSPTAAYGSFPNTFMILDGAVLFIASANSTGNSNALWRTDGTAAGTIELARVTSQSGIDNDQWHLFKGKLYGCGADGLIETDGTLPGTRMVTTSGASSLVASTDRLYWMDRSLKAVYSYDGHSVEVAASAPTAAQGITLASGFGTGIVYTYRDTVGGATTNERVELTPRAKVVAAYNQQFSNTDRVDDLAFRGARYFSDSSNRLWRAGANASADVLLHDIDSGSLTISGDLLFFRSGLQLWKTDGTTAGTVLVRDFAGFPTGPRSLLGTNNSFYFVIEESQNTLQPWSTDGTSIGTAKIADVGPVSPPAGAMFGLATHSTSVLVSAEGTLHLITTDAIAPVAPALDRRILRVFGTTESDSISALHTGSSILVRVNGSNYSYKFSDLDSVRIYADAGNDLVESVVTIPTSVLGGAGDDLIKTGDARDTVYGGDGNDSLYGGGERDWLFGEAGNDRLNGGGARDILWGGAGADILLGTIAGEVRDLDLDDLLK